MEDWKYGDIKTIINNIDKTSILKGEKIDRGTNSVNEKVYFLFIPLHHYNSIKQNSIVMYIISEQAIANIIKNNIDINNTAVILEDNLGEIIFSLNDTMLSIDNNESKDSAYYTQSITSQKANLKYTSFISKDAYNQLRPIHRDFIIAISLLFLIASLLIYFGIHINYKPLKKLLTYGRKNKKKP